MREESYKDMLAFYIRIIAAEMVLSSRIFDTITKVEKLGIYRQKVKHYSKDIKTQIRVFEKRHHITTGESGKIIEFCQDISYKLEDIIEAISQSMRKNGCPADVADASAALIAHYYIASDYLKSVDVSMKTVKGRTQCLLNYNNDIYRRIVTLTYRLLNEVMKMYDKYLENKLQPEVAAGFRIIQNKLYDNKLLEQIMTEVLDGQ